MKKKMIILISSVLVVLTLVISIVIIKNRIPYTEEPSEHIIYESSEQYYLAFNYKGKRYKYNLSEYDWYCSNEDLRVIYLDPSSSFDFSLEKVSIYHFYSLKVTDTSYSFEFWLYFPEDNVRYIINFNNVEFDFNEIFELKEYNDDDVGAKITTYYNYVEELVPADGKFSINSNGEIGID